MNNNLTRLIKSFAPTKTLETTRRVLGLTLGSVSVIFLLFQVRSLDFSVVKSTDLAVVASAILTGLVGRLFFLWAWLFMNQAAFRSPRRHALSSAWGKAWLARYVPGKVGLFYFKYRGARDASVPSLSAIKVSSIETAAGLLATFLVGVGFLGLSQSGNIFAGTVVLSCVTIVSLVSLDLKKMNHRTLGMSSFENLFAGFGFHLFGNIMALPTLFLAANSLQIHLTSSELLYLAGGNLLAGLVGTLAIFAPAGIGIKDAGLLQMSLQVLTPSMALALVVTVRLIATISDLAMGGLLVGLSVLRSDRKIST